MKIDRLIGILTILLQVDKTTAPALAQRFEVSRRTILRDIDSLCLAGIPIVTQQGGDGGISIMDGYKINKSVLTADELSNLVAALRGLDSISKTSNFESLMNKLAPDNKAVVSLTDNVIIDLSSHYKDSLSEKISLIKQAISDNRVISFDYYYNKGEIRRSIEPYFIEFRWNACNDEAVDEVISSGLNIEKSSIVKPPRIKEAFLSFECKLHHHDDLSGKGISAIIVGRVVNAIIEGSHDNPEELCGEKSFMYYVHAPKNPKTGEGAEAGVIAALNPVRQE